MQKLAKKLSVAMAALLTVFTLLSGLPASAAVVPNLQMATQPATEYKVGDRITFTVTSPNFGGKVEYRVICYNGTTKTTTNLWQTPSTGYYYKGWQPSGNFVFPITWVVTKDMQPGAYSLTVLVRRVGAKVAYDSHVDTKGFWVKADAAAVESVAPVADVTVDEGAKAVLPTTVTLNMSDKTTKTANVTWDAVDTTKVGTVTVNGTVAGTDKKVAVKVTVNAVKVGINSVTATAANTLKVVLNKAVDTTKTVLTVKKGTVVVPVNAATWNDAKTEATLVKTSLNFLAGDYTVTLSGLDNINADKAVGTVTLKDQTVTKVEFVGNDLIKAADGLTATFRYVVKDQYGTDITKNVTLNPIASVGGTPSLNASTGVGTITYNFTSDILTKTVVVSLVHPVTGVSATATLNVASAANVASFTMGDIKLPVGATRLTYTTSTTIGTIPVVAKDQYGNALKASALTGAFTLLSSDSTHISFAFDSDVNGDPVIDINSTGTSLTAAQTFVLTAVVKVNGTAYNKIFEVALPAQPKTVTFGDIAADVIASGDTSVVLPITVLDQFGNQLSAAEIAANATAIAGPSGIIAKTNIPAMSIVTDRNSANYGKLTFTAGTKGIAYFTAGTATKTITISDARVVTDVVAPASVYLMQGATKTVKFSLYDQYGKKLATPSDNANLTYALEVAKVSGDTDAVTTAAGVTMTGTDETGLVSTGLITNAATDKTGSYSLTAKLINTATSSTVSQASVLITVVKNNVAGLTYAIDAVPTLNGSASSGAEYSKDLNLTAKDATGNSYVLNTADVLNAVSSNPAVATVTTSAGIVTVVPQNISVNNTAEKTATITVYVNTLDGIKAVTTTVTVSPVAPIINDVKVVTAALGAPTADADLDVTEVSYVDMSSTTSTVKLISKDQYGIWKNVTSANIYVNSTQYAPVDAISLPSGVFTLDPTNVTTGKDLKVTIVIGSVSKEITVRYQ